MAGAMISIWINFAPLVVLASQETQLRLIELYIEIMGVVFGFYGVGITLHTREFAFSWRVFPVFIFLFCIMLELYSFLYVSGIPIMERLPDFWLYLASFVFYSGFSRLR